MRSYQVRAFNTATASNNKIHDDAVAKQFGFAGGLVPGVDVYAYLTHPPAEAWGRDWLERGTMHARFHLPVYDGEMVTVEVEAEGDDAASLTLVGPDGEVRATGRATLPPIGEAPDAGKWPPVPLPERRVPAEPDAVGALGELGSWDRRFHADRAHEYLADIREDLPLYDGGRLAHPGWLVRTANYLLAANVDLGPWIHVESTTQHHGLVADGQLLSTRGRVAAEYERKGHRFVELDVAVVIDDSFVAATIRHAAIYRPRAVALQERADE